MTYVDALDALASHPHIARYRQLCEEGNADVEQRDAYRALVVAKASGPASPATIAGNALSAAARIAGAAITGQRVVAPADVRNSRLAECRSCPRYDRGRCQVCGCFVAAKARFATEQCPLGKW